MFSEDYELKQLEEKVKSIDTKKLFGKKSTKGVILN